VTGRSPSGRRDSGRSREAILAAGSELFARRPYDQVGVREIAARAQVDPALVIRYFGSKENLFLEAMILPANLTELMDLPLTELAAALVDYVVTRAGGADQPATGHIYAGLVRASGMPLVRAQLQRGVDGMVSALAARLHGPDPELRARLIAAQMGGLLTALYVVQDGELARVSRERMVEIYAPAIQLLIDPAE
jgi:AcrR family transcriptional regulator